ncbi:histidine phosphatase family protein [Microbulbifer sp. OS29]|uniref:Histidine phosphatase family protein n=1 Tax=Microbulbifer okhotskensis TaxID=2926617 RepID=A0A9X2J6N0_9GAMM|nr:histidine phosphatase family protein [Microbulbifer okhotskensis]MCO1335579.1 histidine phosphatase family protein [Microbulbifer okhotskensis]
MAEFILVRHGQASFGADNYDNLSEIGWQQSRWLGEYWRDRGIGFDRLICGDLLRHRQTTEGIYEGLEISKKASYSVFPQLNEFDFLAVVRLYGALYPDRVPGPDASRVDFYRFLKQGMLAWAGGEIAPQESWIDFEARIAEVRKNICDSPKGSRTLIVSSGGAIAMMLTQVLGGPVSTVANLNMQIQNTAISHLFFSAENISLHSFNHVPHLNRDKRREYITYS